jgi:RNA polymerase sigma factor (sigma-70 family)
MNINMDGWDPGEFKIVYEKFYNDYYLEYYDYVFRFLKDPEAAKDVLSTVFARLWTDIPRLGLHKLNYAYVQIVVYNKCMDYFKQKKKVKIFKAFQTSLAKPFEDMIVQKEVYAQLYDFLESLDTSLKQTIQLLFIEGMTHDEVAIQMGVALPTVYARRKRALKILKELYKKILVSDR